MRRQLFAWGVTLVAVAMLLRASSAHGQAQTQTKKGTTRPPVRTAAQPQRGASDTAPPATAAARAGATSPAKPAEPTAPFTLTESQQNLLEQVLANWEQHSAKINTFHCNFTRWDYDPTFGAKKNKDLKAEATGAIKYKAPDCGEYVVKKLDEWDPNKNAYVSNPTALDHWICDGKSIYEINIPKKQLIERRLPPEMQGKAIADGPLPFVFGAKAEQLKRRYWMRDITPKEDIGKRIWLEAFPRFQQDQVNFRSARVILNESDFLPYAMEISMPDGKSKTAYLFADSKVNNFLLDVKDFLSPMKPPGYTKVVEEMPTDEPPSSPPQPEVPQAKRPSASPKRK